MPLWKFTANLQCQEVTIIEAETAEGAFLQYTSDPSVHNSHHEITSVDSVESQQIDMSGKVFGPVAEHL